MLGVLNGEELQKAGDAHTTANEVQQSIAMNNKSATSKPIIRGKWLAKPFNKYIVFNNELYYEKYKGRNKTPLEKSEDGAYKIVDMNGEVHIISISDLLANYSKKKVIN